MKKFALPLCAAAAACFLRPAAEAGPARVSGLTAGAAQSVPAATVPDMAMTLERAQAGARA
jgi:hypothetical protein